MLAAYASQRSHKNINTFFLVVFEIDQYTSLTNGLSKEEMGGIFKNWAKS